MRNTLVTAFLTAFVAAAILLGMLGHRVEAMTLAAPSALGVAAAAPVRQAAVVCGTNGCAPVHTSRPRRKTYPLTMTRTK